MAPRLRRCSLPPVGPRPIAPPPTTDAYQCKYFIGAYNTLTRKAGFILTDAWFKACRCPLCARHITRTLSLPSPAKLDLNLHEPSSHTISIPRTTPELFCSSSSPLGPKMRVQPGLPSGEISHTCNGNTSIVSYFNSSYRSS